MKILLFTLLLLSPFYVEILSPFASHNYRVWEGVATYKLNKERPFYVDISIEKTELGDLGYKTVYAVQKNVTWATDEFGYRNTPGHQSYDAVVIGDSLIGGSSLSQHETYTALLSNRSSHVAYAYAPSHIPKFLSEQRFIDSPPKTVIFEVMERDLHHLDRYSLSNLNYTATSSRPGFLLLEKIEDKIDYTLKLSYYRSAISRLKSSFFPTPVIVNERTKMLFFKPSLDAREDNLANIDTTIRTLEEYDEYFSQRGIRFIFLPIPDKETIYSMDLPAPFEGYRNYTGYFPQLISELRKSDVEFINVYPLYTKQDDLVYQLDDTHWNERGVEIAVAESIKVLDGPHSNPTT